MSVLYHYRVRKVAPMVEVVVHPRAGLVATSRTTAVPSRFSATVTFSDRPIRAWLDIRTLPSTGPTVYELRVEHSLTAPGGITTEALRSIPLRELRRLAVEAASRSIVDHTGDGGFIVAGEDVPWHGEAPRGPGRGKSMPADHLAAVAEVYRRAVASGSRSPVEEVRRAFFASRSTAGRWVMQARRRGFLDPAAGPTPGEIKPSSETSPRPPKGHQ